jgi:RsiW-degrading membrane proteinase PrsW (M82 family)
MGLLDTAFFAANLWVLGFALFGAMYAFAWLGVSLRKRVRAERDDEGQEGYLLSAALALLGLLIAFTFSLALNRYDTRRAMVVTEANAVGTAWLRAGLAGEEAGPALQAAITRYTDVRLKLPNEKGNAEAIEAETDRAQRVLWAEMHAAIRDTPPPVAATIITATNEMFDAASARKAERAARIPSRVIEVLILYALMSAGIVGYVLGGAGQRHRVVTTILFALLALALLLILDLDRPWSGGITVSQQPMIDARAAMR